MQRPSAQTKVLVIDDDVTQRLLVKEYLESAGYAVRLADDGRRGLRLAASTLPHIILLDLMLPSLDGYSVCACLRESPATAHIPILLITGSRASDVIERGMAAGASDFITKPVDWEFLADRVEYVLRNAGASPRESSSNADHRSGPANGDGAVVRRHSGEADASPALAAAKLRIAELTAELAHRQQAEAAGELQQSERMERAVAEWTRRLDAAEATAAALVDEEKARFEQERHCVWQVVAKSASQQIQGLTTLQRRISATQIAAMSGDGGVAATSLGQLGSMASALAAAQHQLRFIAQLSANGTRHQPEAIDLAELVAEAADQASGARFDVGLSHHCQSGLRISADPGQLRCALSALIDNAVKFSGPDGVVEIAAGLLADGTVGISVIDHGPGFPVARLGHLREVHAAHIPIATQGDDRLGLGLPLARAVANLHGGKLQIDSQPGQGTAVLFTLPPSCRLPPAERTADVQQRDLEQPRGQAMPAIRPAQQRN